MGTEAPKTALPAGQPFIERLAAIDLVFENFGFKSCGRKKIARFRLLPPAQTIS
ncbi:hypothetical protein [Rhizobium leguminosarum]|uniref:hypothetical protein n=1 Tax=Rhizobium leguminosarum TaxID=384 RepID=UPI003CFECE89